MGVKAKDARFLYLWGCTKPLRMKSPISFSSLGGNGSEREYVNIFKRPGLEEKYICPYHRPQLLHLDSTHRANESNFGSSAQRKRRTKFWWTLEAFATLWCPSILTNWKKGKAGIREEKTLCHILMNFFLWHNFLRCVHSLLSVL